MIAKAAKKIIQEISSFALFAFFANFAVKDHRFSIDSMNCLKR